MTARPAQQVVLADPVEVFEARCWARAHLYGVGELDLHEAIDLLQEAATASGLVAALGQDEVERIMSAAFAPIRGQDERVAAKAAHVQDLPTYGHARPDDEYEGLSSTFADACRKADAEVKSRPEPERIPLQRVYEHTVAKERAHSPAKSTLDSVSYLFKLRDPKRFEAWLTEHTLLERAVIVAHIDNKRDKA